MKPSLSQILNATLDVLNMTPENYKVIKKSRLARAVEVRQLLCYVAVNYGYSQHSIGVFLGLDHATVHYNYKLAESYLGYEESFLHKVNTIMSNFEEIRFYHRLNGWVARDKDKKSVCFFSEKPEDIEGSWYKEGSLIYDLPLSYFPQVSYEDSPMCCELTLRLK